jgi:Na+-driven multidrug efflux pump
MFIASLILAKPLSIIFVGYNETLTNLTTRAFNFYSFVFLFAGVAIYGSAFFTALNNGLVSLIISFLRFAVFQVIFVFILPIFWGTDGIWTACSFAELCSFILAIICIFVNKKRYGY